MRWIPLLLILTLATLSGLIVLPRIEDNSKRQLLFISLLYLAGLGTILFTPVSFDGAAVYIMPAGVGRVNLHRLYLHGAGFIENIILTIPLGFLLKKLVPQLPLLVIGILGVAVGGGIEVLQYYMSNAWLINRSSDINDVIANALGIVIGGLIMMVYQIVVNDRDRT